ncbi:hypothetical protein BJ742DRAFT_809969 [Cladochytrium replicatum]|nr:hypothetical protein BJ742DRAFT_809969 [Cladochytrium replicatum]
MISVPMILIVAARDFEPSIDVPSYTSDPTNPLCGPEAVPIRKGQSLHAIGFDPAHSLFFATNCKQMPFCSIATTGYIPVDVFHPIELFHPVACGVNTAASKKEHQVVVGVPRLVVSMHVDSGDSTPSDLALSTASSAAHMESPMEADIVEATKVLCQWDRKVNVRNSVPWNPPAAIRIAQPHSTYP